MYTARVHPAMLLCCLTLVAPRTVLGRPQFVHLGYPFLELDILALLVGVSLLL